MDLETLKIIACVFGFYVLNFNLSKVKPMTYTFYNFLSLPLTLMENLFISVPNFDDEPPPEPTRKPFDKLLNLSKG